MTCSSAGIVANEVRDGHLLRVVQGVRSSSDALVPLSKCANVDAARRNASPYASAGVL
jgi:hypothetical protein